MKKKHLVSLGTLPTEPTCQSSSFLPKASKVLRPKCVETSTTKTSEEEILVPIFQSDKILPVHDARLGGSWTTGKTNQKNNNNANL